MSAPARRDRAVLALRIDDDAGAGPETKIWDDDAGAFAVAGAADKANMAVIGIAERRRCGIEALADPGLRGGGFHAEAKLSVAASSTPIQRAVPSGTLPASGRRTSDSNSAKSVGINRCSARVKRAFFCCFRAGKEIPKAARVRFTVTGEPVAGIMHFANY
jgi:hypothetical protein